MQNEAINKNAKIIHEILKADGNFPNNPHLPLLIYQGAVEAAGDNLAATIEEIFRSNQWEGCWRNGIYTYHHYHSTAHEVLGIYRGTARVQLGGPEGLVSEVKAGDFIIIPAGVSHKNLGSSTDFACVGAYPQGQSYDMNYGKEDELPEAIEHIRHLPLPAADPVFGAEGQLLKYWKE